jgi:hypothetical protein
MAAGMLTQQQQGIADLDAKYSQTAGEGQYHYITQRTTGDSQGLYGGITREGEDYGNEIQFLDKAGLEAAFNAENNDELRAQFGDFNNYLNYMDERQALINSGAVDPNWMKGQGREGNVYNPSLGLTDEERTQQMFSGYFAEDKPDFSNMSEAELVAYAQQNPIDLMGRDRSWQPDVKGQYNEYMSNPEIAALNEKYGLNTTMSNKEGDQYEWNGTSYVKTYKEPKPSEFGMGLKIVGGVAAGILTGGAASAALGAGGFGGAVASSLGLAPSTVGAMAGAALGSTVAQGVILGKVDPTKVLTSALTAGILDGVNILASASEAGNIATLTPESIEAALTVANSPTLKAVGDTIKQISSATGLDYNTALTVFKGAAVGVVNGGDPETIATSIATTVGVDKATDWMNSNLKSFDIDNFFDEGQTTVSEEAVSSLLKPLVEDTLSGDLGSGTILNMAKGYAKTGSFAFLDPGIEIPEGTGDFFDFLPDVDLMSGQDFGIDFTSKEDLNKLAEKKWEQVNQAGPPEGVDRSKITLTYDQDLVDYLSEVNRDTRQRLSDFDKQFLHPMYEPIAKAGSEFDDAVLQPGKGLIEDAGSYIDDTIIQPVIDLVKGIELPEIDPNPNITKVELPVVDPIEVGPPVIGSPEPTEPTPLPYSASAPSVFNPSMFKGLSYKSPEILQLSNQTPGNYAAGLMQASAPTQQAPKGIVQSLFERFI